MFVVVVLALSSWIPQRTKQTTKWFHKAKIQQIWVSVRLAAGLLQTSIAHRWNTDKDKLKLIHILVANLSAHRINASIQNVGQTDSLFFTLGQPFTTNKLCLFDGRLVDMAPSMQDQRLGYRGSNEDQKQHRPSINIHLWQKKTFASKNDAHLNQRISCCQKVPHLFCMIHQISTNSKWIAKGRRTRHFVWLFHFPLLPVESETTVLWRSWWDKEYWHTFSRVNQDDTSLATSIHHLWSSS